MRGLLQFAVFVAIIFFVVGHFFGGWILGLAGQTPVYVYKKTAVITVKRRTINSSELPFTMTGKLREGTLTVEGIYERPQSNLDQQQKAIPPKAYFEETFLAGQPIRVSEVLERGYGIYQIKLTFEDATGRLTVRVPNSSEL